MAGWSEDDPGDQGRIVANCRRLLAQIRADARARRTRTAEATKGWHTAYHGCVVPAAAFVGNFRGDPRYPGLTDYEVGVGPTLADGYPERVGAWASDVAAELNAFFFRLQHAFAALDPHLRPGARTKTVDLLHEVVALSAVVRAGVRNPPTTERGPPRAFESRGRSDNCHWVPRRRREPVAGR